MKKLALISLFIVAFSCSKDNDDNNSNSSDTPVFNLEAVGDLSEQTAVEAKKNNLWQMEFRFLLFCKGCL